jgi:hypothetical protein
MPGCRCRQPWPWLRRSSSESPTWPRWRCAWRSFGESAEPSPVRREDPTGFCVRRHRKRLQARIATVRRDTTHQLHDEAGQAPRPDCPGSLRKVWMPPGCSVKRDRQESEQSPSACGSGHGRLDASVPARPAGAIACGNPRRAPGPSGPPHADRCPGPRMMIREGVLDLGGEGPEPTLSGPGDGGGEDARSLPRAGERVGGLMGADGAEPQECDRKHNASPPR